MLEPKRYQSLMVALAGAACVAVLLLLGFGSYTSKVRVRGWLVPELGMARVSAPQAGVIGQVFVREGQSVIKGAQLLTLSAELRTEAGGASREQVVQQLIARKKNLIESKALQSTLIQQQRADLERRVALLDGELAHLGKEVEFQRARMRIVKDTVERERKMRARELISLTRFQRTQQEGLDMAARLEAAERSRQSLLREQETVRAQLVELPARAQLQLFELERNISALEQELAEAESKREIVVVAPNEGTVTSVQIELGSATQSGAPLLSILPDNSALLAHLFATSRGVGFLRPGQVVRLRYRAYPYQKFGAYQGQVASVALAAMSPSELSPQLSGLSSLFTAGEPIYRVVVELARQTVTAYGEPVQLQPGMEVEAEILVEKRRLYEWVLDPLWSITGRTAQ